MGTVVFVAFWVIVAVALVLVALRRGSAPGEDRESWKTRRMTYLGFAVSVALLGIVVPTLVLAEARQPDESPEVGVTSYTDQEVRGRELFADQCAICHALKAANAAGQVGPNLDQLRPTKNLVLDAIRQGRARGNGAMAADLVTGADAEAVAAFVAKAVGQTGGETGG